jgi:hypothetical protein
MSARYPTSEQEDPATRLDQSVQAEANIDSDDDTEAQGGKIFVRDAFHVNETSDQQGHTAT